jgi:hypothetical protein
VGDSDPVTHATSPIDVSAYLTETVTLLLVARDTDGVYSDSDPVTYTYEKATTTSGLYATGSNYTELLMSWEELLSTNTLAVNNGVLSKGIILPDNMPEKNEYGFYYGVAYSVGGAAYIFNEDTSFIMVDPMYGEMPIDAGYITYGDKTIDMSAIGGGVGTVSLDGLTITLSESGATLCVGEPGPALIGGDLMLPSDGSVTSLAVLAFALTDNLTGIVIPNTVSAIGEGAFQHCTSLTSVVFENGIRITSIPEGAFYNCRHLTSITIPSTVTSIGDNAFYFCDTLIEVCNKSSLIITVGSTDNGNVAEHARQVITDEAQSAMNNVGDFVFYDDGTYIACVGYTGTLTNLTLPDYKSGTNYVINASAFYGVKSLVSVAIPSTVTAIYGNAFAFCTSLVDITFDEGSKLKTLDSSFLACSGIKEFEIPEGVTNAGHYTFNDCTSLEVVTIPTSVKTIGAGMFSDCSALTTINYTGTVAQWSAMTFKQDWNYNTGDYTVYCTDGTINKNGTVTYN